MGGGARRIMFVSWAACVAACGAFGSSPTKPNDVDSGSTGTVDGGGDEQARDAAPPVDSGGCIDANCVRLVFVTSATYSPATLGFINVGAADGKCTELAGAGNASPRVQGRVFFAWMSDGTGISPDSRMDKTIQRYERVDGVAIATSWAQLTSGTLAAALEIDEMGNKAATVPFVWTGTGTNGQGTGKDCGNWANAAAVEQATVGNPNVLLAAWTAGGPRNCISNGRFYCFEK